MDPVVHQGRKAVHAAGTAPARPHGGQHSCPVNHWHPLAAADVALVARLLMPLPQRCTRTRAAAHPSSRSQAVTLSTAEHVPYSPTASNGRTSTEEAAAAHHGSRTTTDSLAILQPTASDSNGHFSYPAHSQRDLDNTAAAARQSHKLQRRRASLDSAALDLPPSIWPKADIPSCTQHTAPVHALGATQQVDPQSWSTGPILWPQQPQGESQQQQLLHTQQHHANGSSSSPQDIQGSVTARTDPGSDARARKLTSKLQDCNTLQQVIATLKRYAAIRGTLGPSLPGSSRDTHAQEDGPASNNSSSSTGAGMEMPEPALLLQALNSRHLAVLWCTLARVVKLEDGMPVGIFRRPDANPDTPVDPDTSHMENAATAASDSGVTALLVPILSNDRDANGHGAGGAGMWGQSQADTPVHTCGVPLSRVELVALRQLLARLERVSWQCLASGGWMATDAVSAMWAMAQLGHMPESRWLRLWLALTESALPQLGARHLSNALWSLATLGLQPTHSWLASAVRRGLELSGRGDLNTPGHAVIMWSMARVAATVHDSAGRSQEPALNTRQLAAFLQHALARMHLMQPHHVSMMVWAIGHLCASTHPAVQPLLVKSGVQITDPTAEAGSTTSRRGSAAVEHNWISNSPEQGDANVSHSLRAGVNALWREVARLGAGALGPQGTANVLWAAAHVARAQQQHSGGFSKPGDSQEGYGHAEVVRQVLGGSASVLPHMTPAQLYSCAWALACMQIVPSPSWIHVLLVSSHAQLDGFEMQALCGLMWACGRLGVKPGPTWMSAAVRAVDMKPNGLCPVSLPILVWSLGTLGYNPGQVWGKMITLNTTRLVPHMTAQGVSMCLTALARLRLPVHPAWAQAAMTCMLQHMRQAAKRPAMQPRQLAACLQGMAMLGMQPGPDWLETAGQLVISWTQQQQHGIPGGNGSGSLFALGSRQLAGCLYGLARLGHVASDQFLDLATQALIARVEHCHNSSNPALAAPSLDLSQGCWAVAMMGHGPSAAQLQQLVSLSRNLMPHMGHTELAQCVWALQRMGLMAPEPAWVRDLLSVSEARLATIAATGAHSAPINSGGAVPRQAPLLSVATLLRALVLWGYTSGSGQVQAGEVAIPKSWLEAAEVVVEVEAGRRLYSGEGLLVVLSSSSSTNNGEIGSNTTDSLSASTTSDATSTRSWSPEPVHNGSLPKPVPTHVRPSPSAAGTAPPTTIHAVAAMQRASQLTSALPDAAVPATPAPTPPFAYEAGRLSALSVSEVSISRKAARKRLWRGHRMYVQQHGKVLEACQRALRQLRGPGNLELSVSGQCGNGGALELAMSSRAAAGLAGPCRKGFEQQVSGSGSVNGSGRFSPAPGAEGGAPHSDVYGQHDSLMVEHDLRYMPW